MKKSKIIIISAVVSIICFSTLAVTTGLVLVKTITLGEKKEVIKQMKKDFDREHNKLLKGKIPVTEKEINDNANAGDKLKDKGIEVQKLHKEREAEDGEIIPTKDEILSQINLGISMTAEGIENFLKSNPDKSKSDSLNSRNESNVKQLETLKKLKDDLINDKINLKDAYNKVLEIRDGKRTS